MLVPESRIVPAVAGVDAHPSVHQAERGLRLGESLGAENQLPAPQIEQVVEMSKELLAQYTVDAPRQRPDAGEGRDQKLLIFPLNFADPDLGEPSASGERRPCCGGEFHPKRRCRPSFRARSV